MQVSILTATSGWGGAEVHTVALAEILQKRHHDVTIVELGHDVYSQRRSQLDDNFRLVRIELRKPVEKVNVRESIQILRPLQSDVIIFEKGELDSGNFYLDVAARLCSRRYIVIEQLICNSMPPRLTGRYLNGLVPGLGLWWYHSFFHRCLRSLGPHWVVCVSEAVRRQLIKDYRFPLQRTLTIHNGIDPVMFQPNREFRSSVRRAWKIPESALVFGAVGRLAPVKGYETAVGLFKELKSALPDRDIRLVLVGDGPSRAALEKAVHESGIGDYVRFPGFTDCPWEAYVGLDVFLMPSLTEGLPHALLEAMACCCCPIGMDVAGVGEIISNSSVGWLVKPGDCNGFLNAMKAAMACTPEQRSEIGRNARDRVIAHFNSQTQLALLVDLIENGSAKNASRQRDPTESGYAALQ
jgi:glycosyltransferase involved in cell wall biosynthesis